MVFNYETTSWVQHVFSNRFSPAWMIENGMTNFRPKNSPLTLDQTSMKETPAAGNSAAHETSQVSVPNVDTIGSLIRVYRCRETCRSNSKNELSSGMRRSWTFIKENLSPCKFGLPNIFSRHIMKNKWIRYDKLIDHPSDVILYVTNTSISAKWETDNRRKMKKRQDIN
jgi:hypothetical protein